MNSQDLLEGLNIVTRALSSRPAKQILEGVLISAEENRVLMTCSDGSMTIEYTNAASVQEEGQTVLPGMALFIPLIGGTGGNVGTQSSAIVVQGLANGSLELKDAGKHILKEIGVALINATIIAGLVLLYNLIWPADDNVQKAQITTMAVTLSLFGVVLFASVFGTFVPIVLEKLKIDPAIATGPFVTVTNDIVGMIIYMVVSSSLIDIFLS